MIDEMDSKILIDRICSRLSVDSEQGLAVYNALVGVISDRCSELDSISVPGFGSFESKKRMERVNVHPATGKRMLLPPKIVIGFRPSASLKQRINEGE